MEKELLGIGRGYLLLLLTMGASISMVFTGHIEAKEWIGFAQWLVPLVIAAKEAGKLLTKTGEKK